MMLQIEIAEYLKFILGNSKLWNINSQSIVFFCLSSNIFPLRIAWPSWPIWAFYPFNGLYPMYTVQFQPVPKAPIQRGFCARSARGPSPPRGRSRSPRSGTDWFIAVAFTFGARLPDGKIWSLPFLGLLRGGGRPSILAHSKGKEEIKFCSVR